MALTASSRSCENSFGFEGASGFRRHLPRGEQWHAADGFPALHRRRDGRFVQAMDARPEGGAAMATADRSSIRGLDIQSACLAFSHSAGGSPAVANSDNGAAGCGLCRGALAHGMTAEFMHELFADFQRWLGLCRSSAIAAELVRSWCPPGGCEISSRPLARVLRRSKAAS